MSAINNLIREYYANRHPKRFLDDTLKNVLFEPNDEKTRSLWVDALKELFGTKYLISCSLKENTPAVIDRNAFIIKLVSLEEAFTVEVDKSGITYKTIWSIKE